MIGTKSNTSNQPDIHHDGETIGSLDKKFRYSIPTGVSGTNLRRIYNREGWEGSLVRLHAKQPFVWPYSSFLGDYSQDEKDETLHAEESQRLTSELLAHGIPRTVIARDLCVSPPVVSAWASGKECAPKELRAYHRNTIS